MNHLPRIGGRSLAAAAFAVVAAGALYLVARPAGHAADKDEPPAKAAASALDFVPADAIAVMTVHVSELWKHPAGKAFREQLAAGSSDADKAVRGHLGIGLEEIDRLTVFEPAPAGTGTVGGSLVAVTTLKAYDQKAILSAAAPDAKERKIKERLVYTSDKGMSFVFLDNHTFLAASQSGGLEAFLRQKGDKTEGPLTPVLRLADTHLAAAGLDVPALLRAMPPPDRGGVFPFKPLFKTRLATLTVDLDEKLRADLNVTFATEADAADGAAAVDDELHMVRGGLVRMLKDLNRWECAPKTTGLLEDVQAALRAAKAEQMGNTVEVEAAVAVDPEATPAALAEAVEKVRKAATRMTVSNDLKQLGLAALDYASANASKLPAAAVYDKDGKPLLSWRVTLLPYIGQEGLYKEFHLDEPWDSDHNKKLLAKMPTTFAPPDSQAFKDHETFFQAFVGKYTVWSGVFSIGNIPDGTSNVILFVEAKKAVPWTKPEDIPLGAGKLEAPIDAAAVGQYIRLDAGKLLPKLGGLSEGGFMAALCDGSVRYFPATTKEETLRIWATCANGIPRPEPEK